MYDSSCDQRSEVATQPATAPLDPSSIQIATDEQRLELSILVDDMESSGVPMARVWAGRLRIWLTHR